MKKAFFAFYWVTVSLILLSAILLGSTKHIAAQELEAIICDIRSHF